MIPKYSDRISLVRDRLLALRLDGFLTTYPVHLLYLCGFSGSSGALLIDGGEAFLITDGRYAIQAPSEVTAAKVVISPINPLLAAVRHLRRRKRKRIGFEAARITVHQREILVERSRGQIAWKGSLGLVENLRAAKDEFELDAMRDAARLGSEVFEELVPLIKPGVSERDLSAEIDFRMREKGASGPAFETIVASGTRSALPHARPTDKVLQKNELVVIDLGAILRHYCCDLTRTVFLGRAPAKIKHWYKAVREAQDAARSALQSEARASAVDAAARRVLRKYNLDRYFVHSTGHGLGLEVHEEPRLGRGAMATLSAGAVVTLEPGIYIEGVGGIRLEDDVAVHPHGPEVLTSATREFLEL